MNNHTGKVRNLEYLVLEIERNRLEMKQLLAEAKKLRSNGESNKETRKKATSVSKPASG
jgi:hypothetical protein